MHSIDNSNIIERTSFEVSENCKQELHTYLFVMFALPQYQLYFLYKHFRKSEIKPNLVSFLAVKGI